MTLVQPEKNFSYFDCFTLIIVIFKEMQQKSQNHTKISYYHPNFGKKSMLKKKRKVL